MIELNEGGLIGAKIVKQLGNPKRAKTLFALNKRIEICEKLIKENKNELTAKDFEVIEEYKKAVLLQENALITEVKVMGLKQIKLPPKQYAQQRMELLDKHQERYKDILNGITPNLQRENRENSIKNNSEAIARNEQIKREDNVTMSNEEIEELQRRYNVKTTINEEEKTAQQQQKTIWSDGMHIPGIHPPQPIKSTFVYINEESFLTYRNVSLICASPGTGKSSLCESILASVLNDECDALGFRVNKNEVKRAVFFDTERDLALVDRSNQRMLKRANVNDHLENTLIVGLRENTNPNEIKKRIIQVVEHYKPQLILIDGVGDLSLNPNNPDETSLIYSWLNQLCNDFELSIIVTLHPNPGSDKPRGHLGSELMRKCEGFILVQENTDGTRTMITKKARDSAKGKYGFKWSEEEKQMVSCEIIIKPGVTKKPNVIDALTNNELEEMKKTIGLKEMQRGELEKTLKNYIREEHPHVKMGNNTIGIFIKDLGTQELHLIKRNCKPYPLYQFKLI